MVLLPLVVLVAIHANFLTVFVVPSTVSSFMRILTVVLVDRLPYRRSWPHTSPVTQ